MNIVDVIKSQLGGEVLGKLSSLIGESEDKTRTAVDAAVPALLSSLAGLASTGGGAEKLINALRQVDQAPQGGGLGDVLSNSGQAGAWLEKGGSLLSVLLGSAALPTIISIVGKFAGLAAGPLKNLLGYLAPIILASIAKQMGGALTPQRLTSFFAEQKSNIARAVPAGFSLADLPSIGTPSAPSRPVAASAAVSSGLPSWLLPLVGLALLAGLAYWFLSGPAEQPAPAPAPAGPAPTVAQREAMAIRNAPPAAKEAPPVVKEAMAALPDPAKLSTDLGSLFTHATEYLTGVKDAATANAALPKLKDLDTQADGYKALWDKLPDAAKASVAKVVSDHLGALKELAGKVLAIGGVGDILRPVLDALIAKLTEFKA
jgi:hypothetical protein